MIKKVYKSTFSTYKIDAYKTHDKIITVSIQWWFVKFGTHLFEQEGSTGRVIVLIIGIVLWLGFADSTIFQVKTTRLGFEDVGELVTQSAYTTVVESTDDANKLFGIDIPFTQTKYIYSYDVIINAGYDFSQVKWKVIDNKIEVEMPEPIIISNEIDLDSLVVYHEQESIFNQVSIAQNNQALQNLKKTAEQDAINNGLLVQARENAERILSGFFGQVYDLEEYEIVFTENR